MTEVPPVLGCRSKHTTHLSASESALRVRTGIQGWEQRHHVDEDVAVDRDAVSVGRAALRHTRPEVVIE